MFFFPHPPPPVFIELKSPSEAQTNRLITSTHTPPPPPPPPSPTVTIYVAHLKPPFQGRTAGNLKGHTDRILQRTETEQQLWKVGHLQAPLPLQPCSTSCPAVKLPQRRQRVGTKKEELGSSLLPGGCCLISRKIRS